MPGAYARAALGAVAQLLHALVLGAVVAAEHPVVLLQPVADDARAAMGAGGRQRLDRALEAVEGMGLAGHHHLEGFVVIIAASFASRHAASAFPGWDGSWIGATIIRSMRS